MLFQSSRGHPKLAFCLMTHFHWLNRKTHFWTPGGTLLGAFTCVSSLNPPFNCARFLALRTKCTLFRAWYWLHVFYASVKQSACATTIRHGSPSERQVCVGATISVETTQFLLQQKMNKTKLGWHTDNCQKLEVIVVKFRPKYPQCTS